MNSALVMTDGGLGVHRFADYAAAKEAMANIETDGIGLAMKAVVCAWCFKPTGCAELCHPLVKDPISDRMCSACEASLRCAIDIDYPPADVATSLALAESPNVTGIVALFSVALARLGRSGCVV